MFQPKLGVSLHTICKELTDEALAAVEASRIETLEYKDRLFADEQGPARKEAFRQMLRRSGIRPASIHVASDWDCDISSLDDAAHQAGLEAAYASLTLAGEMGTPILVVHASDEPIQPDQRSERIARVRVALSKLGERCGQAAVRVAVEVLPRTCLGNSVGEALEIIEPLDEAVFGLCLDTNHLMDRPQTLGDEVRKAGEKLIALHLSDYDGIDEKHQLPGTGVLDWTAFMAALREIDYAGPFNYECIWKDGTLAERIGKLEENFDWLAGL